MTQDIVSDRRLIPVPAPVNERTILLVVALASSLAPLNSTMIAVGLPTIVEQLGVSVASASWLVTGYLIAMASLQPVAGKLGDRFGRRRLILGGLVYFCVVSIGAALSNSFALLLFFRLQQGVSGAIVFPNGSALVREVVPAERRAGRFGLVGAAIGIAAATGPVLGGFLVGVMSWQAIFYVNLLIILPALWLGWRSIPAVTSARMHGRFDVVGATLLSCALIGVAWLLTQVRGGNTNMLLPGALIALLLFLALGIYELRIPDPVLQPRLFRHRSFAAASGTILFSNMALYTTLLTIPLVLAQTEGWSEVKIGFVLLFMTATTVLFTPIGGRLSDSHGRRWPVVIGMALATVGLFMVGMGQIRHVIPLLLAGLGLAGSGLGIASPGQQTAALESVPARDAGAASGVYSTARYIGSITGSSLLAAILAGSTGAGRNFTPIYFLIIIAAAIATFMSLWLEDRPFVASDQV